MGKKIDGSNLHLWKFKMHMMFSKYEFWIFFYESAIVLSVENEMMDYKINPSMHFLFMGTCYECSTCIHSILWRYEKCMNCIV